MALDFLYDAEADGLEPSGAKTASTAGAATLVIGAGIVRPGTCVVINVSAIDTADADETYWVAVEGSNDSFTTPVVLGAVYPTATGRWVIPFCNWQDGTVYEEIRLYVTIAGTTPSITINQGFMSTLTGN